MYSMGVHSFEKLAKKAKAVYHYKRIVLVNTEKVDEYMELIFVEEVSLEGDNLIIAIALMEYLLKKHVSLKLLTCFLVILSAECKRI